MLFSVLFFVLVPFLFYIRFPLVVVLFFAVLFFVVFGCFFRAFFRAFCGVFLVSFIVLFFVHFFVLFLVFFFRVFFFRALGGTRDKRPQYFAFWPVLFSVLFLVVTTSEDRIYTNYGTQKFHAIMRYVRGSRDRSFGRSLAGQQSTGGQKIRSAVTSSDKQFSCLVDNDGCLKRQWLSLIVYYIV